MAAVWVSQNLLNNEYGTRMIMNVESQNDNKNQLSLVRFDPSSIIVNSTIVSATLRLYASVAPSAFRTCNVCAQLRACLREPVATCDIINIRCTACLTRLFSAGQRFIFGQGADQS
jgi:hypothetical protein